MNTLKYLLIVCIAITVIGCDDFLEENPQSNLTDEQVFATVDNTEAAINGAYKALVRQGYYARHLSLATALSAHELKDPNNTNATYLEFINHQIQPNNSLISVIWADIYYGVSAVNKIIAYGPRAFGDEEQLQRILAEAHFLRGLHYFNLVRLFGAVPLYLEPIVNTDPAKTQLPNAPVSEVYAQIRSDLEYAENNMPADYAHPGRASIYSVKAILAKVYLYLGEYELSEQRAAEVMAGPFSLSESYSSVFVTTGDPESILEIQFNERTGYNGIRVVTLPEDDLYGGQGILASYYESVNGTKVYPFMDFYDSADLRRDTLFYAYDNNIYLTKYLTNPNYDNVSLIRLPEVLLIFAEANARNSAAVTTEAFEAYNRVRSRADVPDSIESFTSADQFIDAIVEEKRREMPLENESWFDYVRAGKAEEFAVTDPGMYVYPIPQVELDVNPNLEQSEGYKQ